MNAPFRQEKPPEHAINVGTRNSRLALIQTNLAINQLEQFYENNPDKINGNETPSKLINLKFNIVSMTTEGDRITDKPLPDIGTKSLFTKDLEVALLEGRVDFIVHSLKDLPTTLPDGCIIGAVMRRHDPNDTIVLKKSLVPRVKPLDLLLGRWKVPGGNRLKIGTSSQRRIAMIRRCNPDIDCIDIRGNLNTRLAKLDKEDGEYAAIILAKAGIDRMGWSERGSCILSANEHPELGEWCYAVGQGAIAIECRSNDKSIIDMLEPIVDLKTTYEAVAERSLMRKLEGGCSVPLGVRSTWTNDNGKTLLTLDSVLLSVDGKTIYKESGNLKLLTEMDAEVSIESELEIGTTGILLPNAIMAKPNVRRNLNECSKLGVEVANKMINSGCLELIKQMK